MRQARFWNIVAVAAAVLYLAGYLGKGARSALVRIVSPTIHGFPGEIVGKAV